MTTQLEELQETLHKFTEEYASLDKAFKNDVTKLNIVTTRHSILVSETTLSEATVKEVRSALVKQKRAYTKAVAA